MTTTIMAESFLETALKKYTVGEADIAILSENCLALKVASVIDKEGYKIVKQARSGVRKKRMEVEDTRKAEKKESLNFGRGIDARAKELTELLTPIEEYLLSQEKIVDDEELRIANEKARLAQEVIDKAEAIKKKEEEDKQAKIKADQEAEDLRLENIRKEQAKKEADLKAKEDVIRGKQEVIEAEKRAIEDQKRKEIEKEDKRREIEQAEMEAEERAKAKAEEDAKAEAERKLLKEAQAKQDEALRMALLPDKEKLIALADKIDSLEMPSLSHDDSHIILGDAKIYLEKACEALRKQG